nr:integrase, catalytic region, zinc finger, CCHC-type, peptidase aspartic, catalytic [Tanacetum cinerariifolium]
LHALVDGKEIIIIESSVKRDLRLADKEGVDCLPNSVGIKRLLSAVIDGYGDIVQIYLWIVDLGCLKHMTGNRALLTNFVEKFLGTVRFGNNDFTVIAGYGDVVIGSMTIKKVYYVEGL